MFKGFGTMTALTDIEKALQSVNEYPVRQPIKPEHEHLLKANHGYWCAHGFDWRSEKAEHERSWK
jgi:hypothetical protein